MKKYAKKQSAPFGKLLKGALLFETVLAAGAYYVWYKMSNHQDFRYRMYSKYPRILNVTMKKYAKKQSAPFGKLLKGALLFETVLAAGAYYVWYKMSNHQDFRYRMYSKYPRILNGFYGILDKFGGSSPRLGDYEKWGVEQNTPRGEESQE